MDLLPQSYSVFFPAVRRLIRSVSISTVVCLLVWILLAGAAAGAAPETPPVAPAAITSPGVSDPPSPPDAQSPPRHLKARSLKKRTRVINKHIQAKAENITSELSQALPERLENEIKKYFGLRYRWGGSGSNGIDCSALTRKVYADVFGIDLPRNSSAQSRSEMMDVVADDDLQTGDLLFFGPRRKRVNHVGIYLAGGYFLHAARSEGVTISRLDNSYWKSRWMLSRRIKDLADDRAASGQELNRMLEQFSLGLAYAGETASQNIHFLDSGVRLSDASEFRLSASYKHNLNPSPDNTDQRWPLALRPSRPVEGESRLRLSAVLAPLPLEGFKLVPSITQIMDNRERTSINGETQTLGLETWMALPSSGVALFLGAQARNREDLLRWPLKMTPDWQTLDFSLGVYYRFSNTLGFSVLSTHASNLRYWETEGTEGQSWRLEDISFKVNYRF